MHFKIRLKTLFTLRPVFVGLALMLFFHLTPTWVMASDNTAASTSFQTAKKYFQDGDYAQALRLFNEARTAGLDKPSLYYNIGVCSYKMGLYDEANKAFLHTATFTKMAALAYYNLAVVAEKQQDYHTAIRWLEKSQASAGEQEEKLLLLTQTALSRIRSKQGLSNDWTRFVALGLGYDDNVAMVDNADLEVTSDEEDSFTDLFAFFRSPPLGASATQGPYVQGSFSIRDYTDLHEYDTGSLRLDGRYRKNIRSFQLEGSAGYSYLFWDHDGYSQSPIFSVQAKHPLGDASSYRLHYEAKYLDILNSNYDYLQGWQHRASVQFVTSSERYRLLLGYSLEENDRHDKESSPRRHLLQAGLDLYLIDRLTISLGASYRDSTYDLAGGNERTDDRYETSLMLSYALSKKWELSARSEHTINISTSPLYDYRRTMTTISLGYTF